MVALPSEFLYGTVTSQFFTAEVDTTGDIDDNPEGYPVVGTATFKPSAASLLDAVAKAIILPKPIVANIDSLGRIISPDGSVGIKLIATDSPSINPINFTYNVSFDFIDTALAGFNFYLPHDTVVDLSTLAPVAAVPGLYSPAGPPGPPGANGINTPPGGTPAGIAPLSDGAGGYTFSLNPISRFAQRQRRFDAPAGSRQVPRFVKLGPLFDTTGVSGGLMFWPSVQRRTPTVGDTNTHVIIYSTDHGSAANAGLYVLTCSLDAADPASTVRYYGKVFSRGQHDYDLSADTQAATSAGGFTTAFGIQSETPTMIYNPEAAVRYAGDPVLSQPWWIYYQLKGAGGNTVSGQVTMLVTASDPINKATYKHFDATAINNATSVAIMDYFTLAVITGGTHTGYRRIIRIGSTWIAPGNLGSGGRRSNFVSNDGLVWTWNKRMMYGQPDLAPAGYGLNFEDIIIWNGERWAIGRMRGNTPDGGTVSAGGYVVMGRPTGSMMEFAGVPQVILSPAGGSITANGKTWTEANDMRNICMYSDEATGKLWALYMTDSLLVNIALADPSLASDDSLFMPQQNANIFYPYRDPADGTFIDLSLDPKPEKRWGVGNESVMPAEFCAFEGKDPLALGQPVVPDSISKISDGVGEVLVTAQPPTTPAFTPHVAGFRAREVFSTISQFGGILFTAQGIKYQTGSAGADIGISICNVDRTAGVTFQQRSYNAADPTTANPEIIFHGSDPAHTTTIALPTLPFQFLGSNYGAEGGMHTVSLLLDRLNARVLVLDKDMNLIAWAPWLLTNGTNRYHSDAAMYASVWVRNPAVDGVTTKWIKVRSLAIKIWS